MSMNNCHCHNTPVCITGGKGTHYFIYYSSVSHSDIDSDTDSEWHSETTVTVKLQVKVYDGGTNRWQKQVWGLVMQSEAVVQTLILNLFLT